MSATATGLTWHEANQRYLAAALATVRAALERHASRSADWTPRREQDQPTLESGALEQAARALPSPSALDRLCATFRLTPFERDVLLLCAGVELDARFLPQCAAAQGDPRRVYPTFSLALAALPEAHWSALVPTAPLRRWRLVEVAPGDTLTLSPLRIDERVLHELTGVPYLDERLRGLIEPVSVPSELPPSHERLADRLAGLWSHSEGGALPFPILQLCGQEQAGKRAVAALACARLGVELHAVRASDLPTLAADREALARLWEREAALSNSALLIDCDDFDGAAGGADGARAALAFLEHVHGRLLLASREPLRGVRGRPAIRQDVHTPAAAEQLALWMASLGAAAPRLNGHLEAVVGQFNLGLPAIRAASAQVVQEANLSEDGGLGAALWDACRVQARPRLDDLAQRLEPAASWEDLVLPEAQQQILRDIASHVRQRSRVYETWGFASKGSRGLGISALFSGASGTGKTMAAEVLASDLRLDLYHIDLSAVVSKYIGETEKNLRRLFDAAEQGGAILFFDEADALFGKRSEVKDSHDRYANVEISYLLQRMEAYRGLAILTTNMKQALDPAFLRRIRFVVQFPFPGVAEREEIWRRIFPADTPTEGLDMSRLARLSVAGGNIRNIALNAAFLAADAGEPVRMVHLLRAARTEYAKLEKPLTETEVGGWV